MPQNTTPNGELTPSQEKVIAALVAGRTKTEAAIEAEIDRSTIYRWLREDAVFVAELNRAKLEQREAFEAEFRGLASCAFDTIRDLLTDTKVPPATRLKAALAVVQGTVDMKPETDDLTSAVLSGRLFKSRKLLD